MKGPLRLGIVIPTLSAFEECVNCLSRIRTQHVWTPYIAPQWENNRAISWVWNHYSVQAFDDGCDYCIIMNDDAFMFENSIDPLITELKTVDNLHLVSGLNVHKEQGWAQDERPRVHLDFSFFAITPQLFDLAGFFDENFYPAYFEDNDYHWRMQLLDLPTYGISAASYYHKGSVTQKSRSQSDAHTHFEKCRQYYIHKWGGLPTKETFKTPYNAGGSPTEWKIQKEVRAIVESKQTQATVDIPPAPPYIVGGKRPRYQRLR